ncbi:MAG: hypothetical protein Q8R30_05265 [bacterium]|nr:hypothetical protein [bacterium]
MKYLIYFFFLAALLAPVALPHITEANSPCNSNRKGYCVKIDAPDSPKQTRRGTLYQFAAAGTPFPGLEFLAPYGVTLEGKDPGNLLSALYNFGIAVAGISALIMYMWAGILYATAITEANISTAKGYISNATIGLILIATSYLILYTINPDFTFKLTIPTLRDIGAPSAPAPAAPPAPIPQFPPGSPVQP